MAILFVDSFSHYSTADIGAKYPTPVPSDVAIVPGAGRGGNACFRFGGAVHPNLLRKYFGVPNQQTTMVSEAALRFSALPPSAAVGDNILMKFSDGYSATQNPHVQLHLTNTGELRVTRVSTTTIAVTSGLNLQPNVWHHIGFRARIDANPAIGQYEVAINGLIVLSGFANTASPTDPPQVTQVDLGAAGGVITDWSDYILSANTRNGDCAVRALLANASGFYNQWLPSAGTPVECVDDPLLNRDTDFISSATQGHKSSFRCQPVPLEGPVLGVQHVAALRKDDISSGRLVRMFVRDQGVDIVQYADVQVPDNWTFYTQSLSPGSTWTKAQVDAMECGIHLVV